MYQVSIPTSTFPYGSNIRVTYRFIPLLKSLKLKRIKSEIIETHTVSKPSYASRSREVLTDEFDPPTWEEMDISTDDRCWYQCARTLHLPKSTRQCLQSVATTVLQVRHSIHYLITLLNPDGHLSSVSSPFLFIYPWALYLSLVGSCFSSNSPNFRFLDQC